VQIRKVIENEWLLGSSALLVGILTLMLAFRLRGMPETISHSATGSA
jgi:hypothetical protein